MREVRKSIYNVSRPSHFGSIQKMPFNVPQQGQENIETAKTEFITWLEQNVDQPLQERMRQGPPTEGDARGGYYEVRLPAPKGTEIQTLENKIGRGEVHKIMKEEYNLKDITVHVYSGGGNPAGSVFLALYPN